MDSKKTCFLICPIDQDGSETRKRSDKLVNYLLDPVCKECNYNLIRSDKIKSNDQIDETIINYLNSANIIIADITDLNPNVFLN